MSDSIATILRSFTHRNVARGQTYAAQGRVTELAETDAGVTAVVKGTEPYRVVVRKSAKTERALAQCTCPAWQDQWQCKHIAAVAWAMSASRKAARSSAAGATPQTLPDVFHDVYSTSTFLSRLGLYVGERLPHRTEKYLPLTDWWWSAVHGASPALKTLARHVVERAPDIEATLATLRAWRAPELAATARTRFTDLYGELAEIYAVRSSSAKIGSALPGPLEGGRHPGFSFAYDQQRRIFEVVEKPSPILEDERRRLALSISIDDPGETFRFEGHAFAEHGAADAWDLFALRALLQALHARTEPAIQKLERDLVRPIWELVLEQITSQHGTDKRAREWRFTVGSSTAYDRERMELVAHARDGAKGRWKRERFEKLLAEKASPLEHQIARLALHHTPPGRSPRGGAPQSYEFYLGTPLGHELLGLLAQHPNVVFGDRSRGGSDGGAPAEITVGRLTMTLDRGAGAHLSPRFELDGRPLRMSVTSLGGDRSALYRHHVNENAIVSVEVPAPLRPWLEMSSRLGRALAFPPEAVAKLASATQSLMEEGIVELPRAALGDELPYEPAAALRLEWRTDHDGIEAVVEVMIRVHPSAPFVAAGRGPVLFTFEVGERRVYVERDLGRELQIAGAALDAIDVQGITWEEGVGRTRELEDAIALAAWLDRNPLGLPIEVKVGRPPAIRPLPGNTNVVVRRTGTWLRVDGSFNVDGIKLTLGEMLEAARLAQRYVRAKNGVFFELSNDAIAKLKPIAMAAQLAPKGLVDAAGGAVIHDAFGSLLAQAADLFESMQGQGIDLREYARRFEKRERRVKVPALEHGALRDYQRDGVAWMLALASWAPGCVLADDMGLGKTVQTAAVLKARAKKGPALIVAPASVTSNWLAELGRFMPSLDVRWYNEDRAAPLTELGAGDVLVVSYGLLQRESAAFREQHWATVVVDEAQYVKNIEAQRSDAVRSLVRDFTIALTGTPLENHLGELFSIVDIAFPGLLGDEATFREHFRKPIEGSRSDDRLAALGALIGPFLLRRTRASVLEELPPREDVTEQVELSLPERKRYLALRNECAKALDKQRGERTPPSQMRIALLAALTRLRQMACDVRLVDPEFDGPSTKIARAVDLAQQMADEGNSVLVFSQFTQFLDKVKDALRGAGLRVALLTGETPTTERRAIIDAFQAGDYDVFCISLLAGGTGLNLTRASYVIHLDPWWNPAVEEQATARAHRMGQTNPVTVYRLVARGTIEQAVLEMHADKRELASAVLEGKGSPKAISSAELLELLRFGG